MKSMSVRMFAAIDVGSFELTMKIYQFSGKNNMRQVDCISQRLDLGSDTYVNGKISNEKVDELCRTLNEFSAIMNAYKVETYRAYGTSAIRETENSAILLDQIEQRTGIRVGMLSNSEQRFLHYKSIASKGESFRKTIEEKTAIVDIGGGSSQISLFENDTLVSTQNLRLGVLRIQDLIHHVRIGGARIEPLIDELVTAQLSAYKKLYLKDRRIKNIIVVDEYISPWAVKRAGGDGSRMMIDVACFGELIQTLCGKNTSDVARKLDVTEEKVLLMLISAVLIRRIAQLMEADCIWVPGTTLCDGIAYEYAEKIKMFQGEHDFEQDIIACAMNISKRYMSSRKRAETLEKIATTIFESMKKVHGLGKRERLYLRIAAILHDCGKYVSMVNIGETSYNIIMTTEIIGLSHMEREVIASVVRFNHSKFQYYGQPAMRGLDREAYLTVAKLTAILRLANSLDRSHKQKLKSMKAFLQDNELILNVDTQEDITLESCFFDRGTEFFTEVFSITPVLKQKKTF